METQDSTTGAKHLVDASAPTLANDEGSQEIVDATEAPLSSDTSDVTETAKGNLLPPADVSSIEEKALHIEISKHLEVMRSILLKHVSKPDMKSDFRYFVPTLSLYLNKEAVSTLGQIDNLTLDMHLVAITIGYTAQIFELPANFLKELAGAHLACLKLVKAGFFYSVDVVHPSILELYAEA